MPEAAGIKIRAELSIEAMQQVQIERRGNPRCVVVRPHESRLIFYQIRSQQQPIARPELRPQITKNRASLLGQEVADARAYVHRERASVEPFEPRRIGDVVRYHRLYL